MMIYLKIVKLVYIKLPNSATVGAVEESAINVMPLHYACIFPDMLNSESSCPPFEH